MNYLSHISDDLQAQSARKSVAARHPLLRAGLLNGVPTDVVNAA
jgi:hypothetical protein